MGRRQFFPICATLASSLLAVLVITAALSRHLPAGEVEDVTARLREACVCVVSTHQAERLLVDIGIAQVKVEDFDGAIMTLETLGSARPPGHGEFMTRLLGLQARLGDINGARDNLADWELGPWDHCEALLAIARALAETGNETHAKAVCQEAIEVANSYSNRHGRGYILFHIARAQLNLADQAGALQTAQQMRALVEETNMSRQHRSLLLAKTAFIYARTEQVESATIFQQAIKVADNNSDGGPSARRLIAALQAEAGDIDAAIRFAESIHGPWGERGLAFDDIARVQLSKGDILGAERTAMLVGSLRHSRDTTLVEIAKAYAVEDDLDNARRIASQISNDTRRAQAMLEIASALAKMGEKERGRQIANALTYPRDPGEQLGRKKTRFLFQFEESKTWGLPYEPLPISTMAGHAFGREMVGDLTAAAMRCRVTLNGEGGISYSPEVEKWDVQKVSRAQAASGDAKGALRWIDRLSGARRVVALIGVAEGIAEYKCYRPF